MAREQDSVLDLFSYAGERLSARLEGLEDDEYYWEPVEFCWSLRPQPDGTYALDGEGGGGPAPDPVPVTTIAWRVGHLGALALAGFTERIFGAEQVPPGGDTPPAAASDAAAFLEANLAGFTGGLRTLDESQWAAELGPSWGPYSEATILDLALHVVDEVIHHGAEIALMRDLYAGARGATLSR